jgi:hypothetical protein
VLLALAPAAAAQRARAPWLLDGTDWTAMAEGEKMAFLRGVIAGTRLEAAAPPLRFAPNVYKARLEDFYFYTDRLSTAIVEALRRIERELVEQTTPDR